MTAQAKSNVKKTIGERSQELIPWGRRVLFDDPTVLISVSTVVTVECVSCHNQETGPFGNFRRRGCGVCKAPFGEKLLYHLIRHYIAGYEPGQWFREYPVSGLDPSDPTLELKFDWACPSLKVTFENHSAYHKKEHKFFHDKITLDERERRDLLKSLSSEGGLHTQGPLKGWYSCVVWFEAEDCRRKAQNSDFLPIVISEFKTEALKAGLQLKEVENELSYQDIYGAVEGPSVLAVQDAGFTRLGPYLGDSVEYVWLHSCGGEFQAPATEILKKLSEKDKTGCRWCDREGHPGLWFDFLDRLARFNILIIDKYRYQNITEHNLVNGLYCALHPEEQLPVLTKSRWNQRLRYWESNCHDYPMTYKPRLEICSRCAVHIEPEPKASPTFEKWKNEFFGLGYTLYSTTTPGQKDANGKQIPTVGELSCNVCKSSHFQVTLIPQKLAKGRNNGRLRVCPTKGCSNYWPTKKAHT